MMRRDSSLTNRVFQTKFFLGGGSSPKRVLHIEKTLFVSLGSYGASPSIAGNSGNFQIVATEPRLHGPRDLRTV